MAEQPLDLPRTVLALLLMGALIAAAFWILRPFLTASIWAAMLVVATWPLMLRAQAMLWGRRWLAVIAMTLLLLLLLFVPLLAAIGSIVSYADVIESEAKSLASLTIPPLPGWISRLPAVGPKLAQEWQELTASGAGGLTERIRPFAVVVLRWLLTHIGGLGVTFVEFILTILVASILYSSGERVAAGARRFARRLGGQRGEHAVVLAGQAIRGVALGVVVTALVQALLGGIGLLVAGVPFTAVLTAVMFILTAAQIGPLPVMLPAVAWLYWMGEFGWATALLVWSFVPVATIDSVLRPFLIRHQVDLPMLLILAGVIGGLISFGTIGIFIGPVVLAVMYELLKAWVGNDPELKAEAPVDST